MQIYKIAYRNPKNILAQDIVREIFNDLRSTNYSDSRYGLEFFSPSVRKRIDELKVIYVNISFFNRIVNDLVDSVDNFSHGEGYAIRVNRDPVETNLSLDVVLYKNVFDVRNSYQINKLYYSCTNTILHEITHCNDYKTQDPIQPQMSRDNSLESQINFAEQYFLSSFENNAYVAGIVLEAKKTKKNRKSLSVLTISIQLMRDKVVNYILSNNASTRNGNLSRLSNNRQLMNRFNDVVNSIMRMFEGRLRQRFPLIK
jgi:hypothetical protein